MEKRYELVIRNGEGDEILVWMFKISDEGKLHYMPAGKTIKKAIDKYEETQMTLYK